MKKILIFVAVVLIIWLVFALSGSDTSNQTSSTPAANDAVVTDESGYTRSQAESLLGISLPEDSIINVILDNDLAVGVLGTSETTIDDLQTFFESEMLGGEYSISRPWGISPLDSDTIHSATYTGSGETWAVILRDENGGTTFDLQRQF